MKNNIFEGAKFGDKFKTGNGRIALVIGIYEEMINDYGYVCCAIDDGTIESHYKYDGTLPYENTKEYEIVDVVEHNNNKENLDKLAEDEGWNHYTNDEYNNPIMRDSFIYGFKEGYLKAMEE